MIIPNIPRLTTEQEDELRSITEEFGLSLQRIHGDKQTIYAMLGDERDELLINRVEGLPYVGRVETIQSPYKLMTKRNSLSSHRVRVGESTLGEDFVVIAGHCTIDPKNPQFFYETAHALKEAGADCLRGGVWKPRTSPHSYQGEVKALEILLEAKAQTKLPVATEIMEEKNLSYLLDGKVDVLQVGARNALNYGLLKALGEKTQGSSTCVLLKRPMHMGKISEYILAAEYIAAGGNPNIILCPRGTQPTMDGYRNHPDESITLLLKEHTWAPIVVDPSHSMGKGSHVPHAAMAAAAYGADGLLVETHIEPAKGIGDDPKQAITPKVLKQLIEDCKRIWKQSQTYMTSSSQA